MSNSVTEDHAVVEAAAEERPGFTPPPPRSDPRQLLREVILDLGLAGETPVLEAESHARATGKSLEAVLLERGILDPGSLERATAAYEGLPHVDLATFAVDEEAVRLIGAEDARRFGAQPVAFMGSGAVLVVMADARDEQAFSDLTFLISHPIERGLAGRDALAALIAGRTHEPVAEALPDEPFVATTTGEGPPAPEPTSFAAATAATPALEQLQAVLRGMEAEVENRIRVELAESEGALHSELETERSAHEATRLELAGARTALTERDRRIQAALVALEEG